MRLWLWAAVLRAAALLHRDPWHAARLRELSDELLALDRAASRTRPKIPKAPVRG